MLHEISSPEGLNTSNHIFYESVLSGKKRPEELEAFQGEWVDVRDVSYAHVRAIEVPEAGGNRFITSSEGFIWQDWCTPLFSPSFSHMTYHGCIVDAVNGLKLPGISAAVGTPGRSKTIKWNIKYNHSKADTILGTSYPASALVR